MNTQTLDKQSMDALQALAETNMKVSTVKGLLLELEATKDEFLKGREEEALKRVEKAFEESGELLAKIQTNYDEIHQLLGGVSAFVDFLVETQTRFGEVVQAFEEKVTLWEETASGREKNIHELQRKIEIDRIGIETDKKSIKKGFEKLEKAKIKLESDQGLLERNIKRLKEGRI